jgi:hypothetical protein
MGKRLTKKSLAMALLRTDAIARRRGDQFGLCDCMDSAGDLYGSQWLYEIMEAIRAEFGDDPDIVRELSEIDLKIVSGKFSTSDQWKSDREE